MKRRTVDIAFTRAKVAVFIDGCFWHSCPEHATRPAANDTWWSEKLAKNVARDEATNEHLHQAGWHVIRVWEHEDPSEAATRIVDEVMRQGRLGRTRP